MATLFDPDGTETDVRPAAPEAGFTLSEMYRLIGCETVELVTLADGRLMLLDEDGKARKRPRNREASRLLGIAGGMHGDYVAGPALVCADGEVK